MTPEAKAYGLFLRALRVPAYAAFLKKLKIKRSSVRGVRDFNAIPLTSKREYIYKYPKADLVWPGSAPIMSYASSGSSGSPTYWFSDLYTEKRGGLMHEIIFRDIFGIKKRDKTLVVVCFSMGLWVAGVYTLLAARFVAQKGYRVTIATPGLEKENIYGVFKHVAPEYDTVILAGYPPFITDILAGLKSNGISQPKNLKVLTGGDKFTEEWRDTVLRLIGSSRHTDVLNVYGTAETTIVGHESPLTVFIRRALSEDRDMYRALCGEGTVLPGVFQYDPSTTYFEQVGQEIAVTLNAAMPLIRYNIHDVGAVVPYKAMFGILTKHGYGSRLAAYAKWKAPFVIVKARTDVAITYYAFNIYPEHLRAGLVTRDVSQFVTKSYVVYTAEKGAHKTEKLYIEVELQDKVKPSAQLVARVRKSVIEQLIEHNTEFAKLHRDVGDDMLPTVTLKKHGTLSLVHRGAKTIASVHGKKPRVVIR